MKKNNNIKIAKELIRIAKILIENEKTARWNWKHPFSFTKKSQKIYELEYKIKNDEITDTVLIKLTNYIVFCKTQIYTNLLLQILAFLVVS